MRSSLLHDWPITKTTRFLLHFPTAQLQGAYLMICWETRYFQSSCLCAPHPYSPIRVTGLEKIYFWLCFVHKFVSVYTTICIYQSFFFSSSFILWPCLHVSCTVSLVFVWARVEFQISAALCYAKLRLLLVSPFHVKLSWFCSVSCCFFLSEKL
jgi:hypothetical protein